MIWDEITNNSQLIKHYNLLSEIGVFDHFDEMRKENRGLENLLEEACEIFTKESVDDLIGYIIKCLSDKFVPTNLVFILNHGITVDRINVLTYKNLKRVESELDIKSLTPYEKFFKKYSGTTSFYIFESEIEDEELIKPFKRYDPEIMVPVLGLSGLYGIILFGPKILDGDYSGTEISYINRLMKFTSIGIQNNIHYEHSVKDPKTGLYNHNFFISFLREEVARSRRNNKVFTILMLDIDNFKKFNDSYGHLAGDEAIIKIADAFRSTMREEDVLSRFGGEEFTVFLPETNDEAAWIASERLRKRVEKLNIEYQNEILKVTISIGISVYCRGELLDANEMIKRADSALYKSKKNGRNQSTFYE
jgi:diguanylate cyclase (GGDEF)-like protein